MTNRELKLVIIGIVLILATFLTLAIIDMRPARVEYSAPVTKTIAFKQSAIEQRNSFDLWDDQMFRKRTVTIFYLFAEDSSNVEVGVSEYAAVSVGDNFTSKEWRLK